MRFAASASAKAGRRVDGDAAKGLRGVAVHAEKQLRRQPGARGHMPGIKEREPHEVDDFSIDLRCLIGDPPGPDRLQPRPRQ